MVCSVCSGDITDRAMKAGGRLYHYDHFTCTVCGMSLADPGAHQALFHDSLSDISIIFAEVVTYTKHDQLYCQEDYMRQFAPVCAKCDQYITQVTEGRSHPGDVPR